MNITRSLFLTLIFFSISLYAVEKNKYDLSLDENGNASEQLRFNREYLSLMKKDKLESFRYMRNKKDYLDKELLNLNNLKISPDIEILELKDIVFLKMHSAFPRTLRYPVNTKIANINPVPSDIAKLSKDETGFNVIDIIISPELKKGTILVKYLDENNIRKDMTIVIENYEDGKGVSKDSVKKEKDTIYLITELKKYKKISPLKVLEFYKVLNDGKNPKNKDGVKVNYTYYTFFEDDIKWDLIIDNKKFRVTDKFKGN